MNARFMDVELLVERGVLVPRAETELLGVEALQLVEDGARIIDMCCGSGNLACALACRPELILADEPVSMLDVSVRIGVLNLMTSLRRRERISFLYITHDIASARYVADRLVVMYAGQVAESGPVEDVLAHPKHPYTQLLLSAVPDPRAPMSLPATAEVQEPPRVVNPGEGCRFRARCPYAIEECSRVTPRLRMLRPDHLAACHVATSELEPASIAAYIDKDARASGG
jgi:oligopeptide/dipeptide ABC transporter ATP-binding protein